MPTRQLSQSVWLERKAGNERLIQLLGFKCEHFDCQQPYLVDTFAVHEWCVSGHDLQNVDYDEIWLFILLHPFNLMLLHNSPCHIEKRPSKEAARQAIGKRMSGFWKEYGLKNVEEAERDFKSGCEYFVQRGMLKNSLV